MIGEQKEAVIQLFPEAAEQLKQEGKLEDTKEKIFWLIETKFGSPSAQLKKKIEKTDSEKKLNSIFKKAAQLDDLKKFETEVELILKKK